MNNWHTATRAEANGLSAVAHDLGASTEELRVVLPEVRRENVQASVEAGEITADQGRFLSVALERFRRDGGRDVGRRP